MSRTPRVRVPTAALALLLVLNALALSPIQSAERRRRHDVPIPDPPVSIPPPPARGPNGEMPVISDALKDLPLRAEPNHVKAMSTTMVRQLEAEGSEVVENHDGLIAIDVRDETGKRTRLAAIDTTTDGAAMGIVTGHPWLGWITGVAFYFGTNFCRTSPTGATPSMLSAAGRAARG